MEGILKQLSRELKKVLKRIIKMEFKINLYIKDIKNNKYRQDVLNEGYVNIKQLKYKLKEIEKNMFKEDN